MNKLTLIALLCTAFSIAQIKFEKGYYVDNTGNRHEVLIRNADWNDNPRKIAIKGSTEAEIVEKTIDEIQEFAITGSQKFVRADIGLDRSASSAGTNISGDKNPHFVNERIFLRSLVDGSYKLYIYEESGLQRFYYQTPLKPLAPLVYKKYHPTLGQTTNSKIKPDDTDYSAIWENNQFRNQLWNDARCPDTKLSSVERLKYSKSSLVDYFVKVNNCSGSSESAVTTVAPSRKGKLNFGPVLGITMVNFSSERDPEYWSIDKSETSFQFGAEVEYILPTNANKIAVFADPHYYSFKGGEYGYVRLSGATGDYKMSFTSLSIPVGVRYYFFMGADSKIFLDGAATINITKGDVEFDNPSASFELDSHHMNFGFGGGFNYKRYSVGARYYTVGQLHPTINAEASRLSFFAKFFIL